MNDLTRRIDKIIVSEAVSDTLNDLTPEQIAIFDAAVEGRYKVTYLLDSNIVSYILKKITTVNNKLLEVNLRGDEIFISCITYYEVKRGLLALNATRQLADFQML